MFENIKVIEALKAKEFEKITEKLLESGRLSYFEFYKCNNFLKIAKRADNMIADIKNNQMEDANNKCNQKFSFDWLMGFFCIFREICASVPEERSAIPLETEQRSVG